MVAKSLARLKGNKSFTVKSMDIALERHFTVREISEIWQVSDDTVRRVFRDEPGVLAIGSEESRFKRGYLTLLIPESVVKVVHRKHRRRPTCGP